MPRHESELRPDLLERDAVVGLLRRPGLDVHRRAGHELTDQLAHLAEGAVLALVADVEDLPPRGVRRCLQAGDDRVGTVFDVDERAPLGSAEDRDRALTNRFGREEIHDEVEAGPRREPVEGPEAQRGGAEDIGRGGHEHALGIRLRARVHRHRRGLGVLVEEPVGVAVDRAARREHEPRDAEPAGHFSDHRRGVEVDLERELLVHVA